MKDFKSKPIYNLILSALFASITVLCAWITIPMVIPFTLQTLAVFMIALLLDTKYGLLSICLYIALGIIGLPVFSGFQGGIGVLLSPTGGYIWGFVFIILSSAFFKKVLPAKTLSEIISLSVGLIICYLFGTLWFMYVSKVDFVSALIICVLPYILFDSIKIAIAIILAHRLKKIVN